MGAHLAPLRGAPAGRRVRSWTGPQLCPQLELHPQGQVRGGPGSPQAKSTTPGAGPAGRAGRQQPRARGWAGRAACWGRFGSGEVPGGSRSSRNSHAAIRHPWHVCRTWQQVWQPQYKPRPCRSLPGLQALQKEFKKQCTHTFHRHKGGKKYISRFQFFPRKGQTHYCIQLCPKKPFTLCGYSLLLLILTGLSRFLSTGSPPHALQAISENCAGCAVHRSGQHF